MAAVDKITGTKKQYIEFMLWCHFNNPDALQYFYDWDDSIVDDEYQNITNFPEHVDKWMLKNCDIEWVVKQIKFQYEE